MIEHGHWTWIHTGTGNTATSHLIVVHNVLPGEAVVGHLVELAAGGGGGVEVEEAVYPLGDGVQGGAVVLSQPGLLADASENF